MYSYFGCKSPVGVFFVHNTGEFVGIIEGVTSLIGQTHAELCK